MKRARSSLVCAAWLVALSLCGAGVAAAQQVADTDFRPAVGKAAFAAARGPLVLVDEAHANFHTAGGRYQPFAALLERDGYVVEPSAARFSKGALAAARILVVANAIGARNRDHWEPPIDPAFTADEIKALHDWVNDGGALLLIIDHVPFPQAANALALAFGVHLEFGVAVSNPVELRTVPELFARRDGALADHAITRGRVAAERVDTVATFTGCAFKVDRGEPLLTFVSAEAAAITPAPEVPPEKLPRVPIHGWLQGAVLRVGKGRVAVFGEAAMFSAQLAGPTKTRRRRARTRSSC